MAEEPYHSPPPDASSFAQGLAYYVSVLLSGQLQERVIAAETLGDMGDARAVEPLIKALDDPDTEVRWVAAKSLGMLGDPRAVPALIRALSSDDKWLRCGGATASACSATRGQSFLSFRC
jgi:HEAT repeat protein